MKTEIEWIRKALELKSGEDLYLPCENRVSQRELLVIYKRELRLLKKIAPEDEAKLLVTKVFKDHRYWLILKRISASPLVGFVKRTTGEVEKCYISSLEKERMLFLMRKDGLSEEEIKKILGKEE